MTELPVAFWATFAGVVGACVGSFLNVVAHRVPRGLSVVHPPSACPRCATPIRARHNVPVLGWLLLRGRCYDCALPISVRYPVVEALSGALPAAVTAGLLSHEVPWQLLPPVVAAAGVLVVGLSAADRPRAHRG